MKNIKGVEKIEKAMESWSPRNLAFIEGIELKKDSDVGFATNLIVTALFQQRSNSWPNFDKEIFRVTIQFDDIGGLCLKNFGGGAVQIMGFDIHFVGDRGMERINYEIEDYEDNRIKFYCRNISIQSVELAVL